jgi:predicted  nucleic acid-binding Zn-ribbon protein
VGEKIAAIERALDGRLGEVASRANTASERLQAIDRRIEEGQRSQGGVVERLVAIERSLGAQRAELAHLQTAVSQDLEAVVASAKIATSGALETSLDQRFERLIGAIDAQRNDIRQMLPEELGRQMSALGQTLTERVDGLEVGIGTLREGPAGLVRQIEADRARAEEAVARLHGAQQTLSAAVDQWRKDNGMRLESIATAIGGMHGAGARTAELLESQAGRLEILSGEVHEVTKIQRASLRQRGFWRWLFGLR